MKRFMLAGLTAAAMLIACTPVFAEKQEQPAETHGYVAANSSHTQQLGGKSNHASKGLSNAAEHTGAIQGGGGQQTGPK